MKKEIIVYIDGMEKEIRDLRGENAQLKAFLAVIAKKLDKEVIFDYTDIFSVDYKNVQLRYVDKDSNRKVSVEYIEEAE